MSSGLFKMLPTNRPSTNHIQYIYIYIYIYVYIYIYIYIYITNHLHYGKGRDLRELVILIFQAVFFFLILKKNPKTRLAKIKRTKGSYRLRIFHNYENHFSGN